MDTEKGLLNGKFSFKVLPNGSLVKTKVICIHRKLSYHRSTSSLKYHMMAKELLLSSPIFPEYKKHNKYIVKLHIEQGKKFAINLRLTAH